MPVWEQLATDQIDPWQVVPRQVFTPYSRLLISTAFVVVSHVGCFVVTGEKVDTDKMDGWLTCDCTSYSTIFQSYQDDGRLIMKGCPVGT